MSMKRCMCPRCGALSTVSAERLKTGGSVRCQSCGLVLAGDGADKKARWVKADAGPTEGAGPGVPPPAPEPTPVTKAPPMFTLNGFGTRLYGNSDPASDGSHTKVLWITALFIPLVPLSAYRVVKAEDGGWYFLAKVPLPAWARPVQMVAVGALAVALAAAINAIRMAETTARVAAYNGYGVPVLVETDADQWLVPAWQSRDLGRFGEDTLVVRTKTKDGRLLEEQTLDLVPGHGDEVIYNAMGRGVIRLEYIRYGDGDPPEGRFLGGGAALYPGDVDYLFRDPPEQKKVSGSGDNDTYTIDLAADPSLWLSTVASYTADTVSPDAAYELAWAEFAMNPRVEAADEVRRYAADPAELLVRLTTLRAALPGSVEVHRLWQTTDVDAGGTGGEEAYLAQHAAEPEVALWAYLGARVMEGQDDRRRALLQAAVELDPDLLPAWGALGNQASMERSWGAATHAWERASGEPSAGRHLLVPRLQAMRVQAGKAWPAGAQALFDQADIQRADTGVDPAGWKMAQQWIAQVEAAPHRRAEVAQAALAWQVGFGQSEGQEAADEAYLLGQLDLAAGDAPAAMARLPLIEEAGIPGVVGIWRLIGALSPGAEGDAYGAWLAEFGQVFADESYETCLLAAAAGQGRSEPQVAALKAAAQSFPWMRGSPAGVLDQPLPTPEALDAVLGEVSIEDLGLGYAAAAVRLEREGRGQSAVARHARRQARLLGLVDRRPAWSSDPL